MMLVYNSREDLDKRSAFELSAHPHSNHPDCEGKPIRRIKTRDDLHLAADVIRPTAHALVRATERGEGYLDPEEKLRQIILNGRKVKPVDSAVRIGKLLKHGVNATYYQWNDLVAVVVGRAIVTTVSYEKRFWRDV